MSKWPSKRIRAPPRKSTHNDSQFFVSIRYGIQEAKGNPSARGCRLARLRGFESRPYLTNAA